jgi:hypothetical protein
VRREQADDDGDDHGGRDQHGGRDGHRGSDDQRGRYDRGHCKLPDGVGRTG